MSDHWLTDEQMARLGKAAKAFTTRASRTSGSSLDYERRREVEQRWP